MARKPRLTFSLSEEDRPATEAKASEVPPKPAKTLKQVGARLPEQLYRQLKSHAALSGEQVQTVLEEAIKEYLERRAEG